MVKGFTRDGKFHPTTSSSGAKRKKRIESKDILSPTGGVKMHLSKKTEGIRLARFDSRFPTPRIGKDIPDSTKNDARFIERARERIEHLGDRRTAKAVLVEEGYEFRVINKALDKQFGKERNARDEEEAIFAKKYTVKKINKPVKNFEGKMYVVQSHGQDVTFPMTLKNANAQRQKLIEHKDRLT